MGKYAVGTSVSTDKTKMEIERVLRKYGADGFSYGWEGVNVYVAFRIKSRPVKIAFSLPNKNNREFTHTESRNLPRDTDQAARLWEQACRESWRSLLLFIKATLEAIEIGIITFDQAFLPYLLRSDGLTVAEWILPQMPKMLALTSGKD
jgi:hypothetical protein